MKATEIFITLGLYVPLIVVLAICIALEVYLAKRKSRWPGLVMPVLWFVYILLMTVAAVAGYAQAYGEPLPLSAGLVWSALLSLVQANIPTYVLLAVYFFCRSGRRRKKQLDRMQVQDL